MHMGHIRIEGEQYRGPSNDNDADTAYPFEITEGGTINWGGPLGGLSSGGNTVVSSVIKDAGGGAVGFDVIVQTETGSFHTVSCSPD